MGKKVLVIDDEPSVGEIAKDFLDELGYETYAATNVDTAIELVTELRPELVLLDVIMPGMSGVECLKKIKEISPETIVLMVSGMADEGIAKEAIQLGAYDYISKPFDLTYLENLVSRILA